MKKRPVLLLSFAVCLLSGCGFLHQWLGLDGNGDNNVPSDGEVAASKCTGNACSDVVDRSDASQGCPQCREFVNVGSKAIQLDWRVAPLGPGSQCSSPSHTKLLSHNDRVGYLQALCLPYGANYIASASAHSIKASGANTSHFVGVSSRTLAGFTDDSTVFIKSIRGPSAVVTSGTPISVTVTLSAAPATDKYVALRALTTTENASAFVTFPNILKIPMGQNSATLSVPSSKIPVGIELVLAAVDRGSAVSTVIKIRP